jgi:hypothetical protein
MEDLFELAEGDSCAVAGARLEGLWALEQKRAAAKGVAPNFERAAWGMVSGPLLLALFYKMGWLAFALLGNAVLLGNLVTFFSNDAAPTSLGLWLSVGFLGTEMLRSAFVNHHWFSSVMGGVALRSGVRHAIFSKLSRAAGSGTPPALAVTAGMARRFGFVMFPFCHLPEFQSLPASRV